MDEKMMKKEDKEDKGRKGIEWMKK